MSLRCRRVPWGHGPSRPGRAGQRPRGPRAAAPDLGVRRRRRPGAGRLGGGVHAGRVPVPRHRHARPAYPVPRRAHRHTSPGRGRLHGRRPALLGAPRTGVPLLRRGLSAPPRGALLLGLPRHGPAPDHDRAVVGHRRPARRARRRTARRRRPRPGGRDGRVDRGRGPLARPHRAAAPVDVQGGHRPPAAVPLLPAAGGPQGLLRPQGDRLGAARVRPHRSRRRSGVPRGGGARLSPLSVREAGKHL